MSQAPHVVRGARWGLRLGPAAPLEDTLWEALRDANCGLSMAETAEKLAEQYRISREAVDCFAALSQARAKAAWDAGVYADEVVPVPIRTARRVRPSRGQPTSTCGPATTPEALAKLPPYFRKDGVVTAGNASGICDGAAALVVAERGVRDGSAGSGRWAGSWPGPRRAWIPRSWASDRCPPPARALATAGLELEQMDLVEINEAFAAQYLAVEKELGLDRERTNVDGGAVASGPSARRQRRADHPASAARPPPHRRAIRARRAPASAAGRARR